MRIPVAMNKQLRDEQQNDRNASAENGIFAGVLSLRQR
jgi:hypothetical protein